jgi:hypothetical protein
LVKDDDVVNEIFCQVMDEQTTCGKKKFGGKLLEFVRDER